LGRLPDRILPSSAPTGVHRSILCRPSQICVNTRPSRGLDCYCIYRLLSRPLCWHNRCACLLSALSIHNAFLEDYSGSFRDTSFIYYLSTRGSTSNSQSADYPTIFALFFPPGNVVFQYLNISHSWKKLSSLLMTYQEELKLFPQYSFAAFQRVTGDNRRLDVPFIVLAADAVLRDPDLQSSYQSCLEDIRWQDLFESGPLSPQHIELRTIKNVPVRLFPFNSGPSVTRQPILQALLGFVGTVDPLHTIGWNARMNIKTYNMLRETCRASIPQLGRFSSYIFDTPYHTGRVSCLISCENVRHHSNAFDSSFAESIS